MHPALNTSLIGNDLVVMSLMLMIYGATYPGVPQRTNKYLGSSARVARPKSIIIGYFDKIMFSGFKSLCITFFLAISLNPLKIPFIITLL